jgi:hypothetical protein
MHYQIPKRAHHCSQNDEPFSDNEEIVTLLIAKKSGYDRRDLCLKCFAENKEKFSDQDVSYWKVVIQPKSKKAKFKKSEDFLHLLRTQEMDESAYYLLCLFLERQKVLYKQKENQEELFFECLDTGEIFISKKSPISQETLNQLIVAIE